MIRDSSSSFILRAPQSSGRSDGSNRCFQFHKRHQLFIRVHNVTFTIVAMRVRNKDRSPVRVHGCNTAPTPTGFAEIVSDNFPVVHPIPGRRPHNLSVRFELQIRVRERQATLDLRAQ